MFMPLALPLALNVVIAVADGVPKLDVTGSCRGAAAAAAPSETRDKMRNCLDSEQKTRDELAKVWVNYAPADRAYCLGSVKNFEPTYTELATCLEMKRDVRKHANAALTWADTAGDNSAVAVSARLELSGWLRHLLAGRSYRGNRLP